MASTINKSSITDNILQILANSDEQQTLINPERINKQVKASLPSIASVSSGKTFTVVNKDLYSVDVVDAKGESLGQVGNNDYKTFISDGSTWKMQVTTNSNLRMWNPQITFESPGNLSVNYSGSFQTQGFYERMGNSVFATCVIAFKPTFSNASGNLIITGLPFTANDALPTGYGGVLVRNGSDDSEYKALGIGSLIANLINIVPIALPNSKNIVLSIMRNNAQSSYINTTHVTSNIARLLQFYVFYYAGE